MKKLLLAGVALLAIAGTVQARDINVAQSSDLRTNMPGVNRDGNTDSIMLHIVEGLVGYTDNGDVKPLLARSVETSDDGLTYTFRLREGVKFHNGATLTAQDVVWNWNRYMDKKSEWGCVPDFDGSRSIEVTGIAATDDMTVEMTIKEPSALLLALMARPECGFTGIIHKDLVAADGTFVAPIGTGPFKWGEWRKGEFVRLIKFDDYASPENNGQTDGMVGSKRPLVDGIKFSVIPDASSVKAGLLSGALDTAEISADLIPEFKNNATVDLVERRNNGNNLLYIQTKDPVVGNPAIRRAMAHALDLDQLVAAVSNGTGTPNSSMISIDSLFYSDVQKQKLAYDLDAAKKELEAAGYKGEPITIIANKRGNVPSYPAAVIAQAMWQQVGLNVQIEVLDYATQVSRRRSGQFQIISQSVAPRIDPAVMYNYYVGNKDKDPAFLWDNAKAIELKEAAYREADKDKRQAIFDEFHKLMLQEMPGIFMYDMVDVWGKSKKLTGSDPVWQSNARLWEVSIAQ